MTILGIVLYAALNGFFWLTLQESFASTVSDLWPWSATTAPNHEAHVWAFIASAGTLIAFDLAAVIYVFALYLSYFSPKPRATGSRAISFLNGLFGALPFAPLWNTCLTKRRRGISWGFALFLYLTDMALVGYLLVEFVLEFVL